MKLDKKNKSLFWALWIYIVAFYLVTVTFFTTVKAEEIKNEVEKIKEVKDNSKKEMNQKSKIKENIENTKNIDIKDSNIIETKKGKELMVLFETSMGPIKIKLDKEKAPITVENFLKYVDEGFYNNTIFHRVIDNFMIQGGGFTEKLVQKETKKPIKNEAANGLKNKKGTIAMARTNDPNSATAQFFINVKDNGFLDFRDPSPSGIGYCVFGEVVDGMDTVEKIKMQPTHFQQMDDVPKTPIIIKSAKRVE